MVAGGVRVDASDMGVAADRAVRSLPFKPQAVIGTDDASVELAAAIAHVFGLPANPVDSSRATRRKDLARDRMAAAGCPGIPRFARVNLSRPVACQARDVEFPRIVKPVDLSAGRGVIRADTPGAFEEACRRIGRLQKMLGTAAQDMVLAEEFVPGAEVALDGLLHGGEFRPLVLFDKPDPMDGPFFEETFYVSPSRLPADTQTQVVRQVSDTCRSLGLTEGPVHAECRINERGVWLIEIAARTIGGECARALRFRMGRSLEELVVLNALGRSGDLSGGEDACGVLMIPVPMGGIVRRVEGIQAARRVRYIEDLIIDVRTGQQLVPWPEGCPYPGFIFSRAPSPEEAETALRRAHARLRIVVAPAWSVKVKQ